MQTNRILALVDVVYEAALNRPLWQEALARLSAECSAETASIGFFRDSIQDSIVWNTGLTESARAAYTEHFVYKDPITPVLMKRLPNLSMASEESAIDSRALLRSEFHNDWARPNRLRHCLVANIHSTPGLLVSLTIGRGPRAGSFEASGALLKNLDRVLPHVKRAAELHLRYESAIALRDDLESGLDALGCSALLVDVDATLLHANKPAFSEALKRGPFVIVQGRLAARDRTLTDALYRAIRRVSTARGISTPEVLDFPGASVTVWPVPRSGRLPGLASGRAMVVLKEQIADVFRMNAIVAKHRLTRAEADVFRHLRKGLTIRAISEHRGTSVGTVRNQVKTIMSKVGVSRQIDLIRGLL